MTHVQLSDELFILNIQRVCCTFIIFLPQSIPSGWFSTFIGTLISLSSCLCAPTVPPVGEAINCESVIEMRMYIDAAPVCFLGCQPSAPSLRGVHSNAFVIIIKNRSTFSSTQIYNCCRRAGIWPMTCSSCMKKSVITFSSFAIPSGSWVHFSVNAVYPTVWRIFLQSNDLLITLWYSH